MNVPYLRNKNESIEDYLVRLYDNKDTYELDKYEIANLLNKEAGTTYDESKWRKDYASYLRWKSYLANKEFNDAEKELDEIPLNYKETVEIAADGSHKSDKLIRMSAEQSKDVEFLLKAHGYDKDEWELVSARNNIWNVYSKQDGIQTLYSSKITVKPKTNGFSFEELLEEIRNNTEPVYIKSKYVPVEDKRLLEIPFFDTHFGISDYEYYKKTQDDTIQLIESRRWEEIVFTVGQDMLHNDNFKGQTANGTFIEKIDMRKAWRNAKEFYYPMIDLAISNSNKIKIIYSKGNHDESMSWAFVQMLMERYRQEDYPQIEFDDSFEERKCHVFGDVFIGFTHGDKAKKNLHNLFQVEFPLEWAKAKTREIHSGHLHTEDSKDWFGMMVRTLATRNKTDQWHKDNGFVGNHKRFMLFEYTENALKSIHYV